MIFVLKAKSNTDKDKLLISNGFTLTGGYGYAYSDWTFEYIKVIYITPYLVRL